MQQRLRQLSLRLHSFWLAEERLDRRKAWGWRIIAWMIHLASGNLPRTTALGGGDPPWLGVTTHLTAHTWPAVEGATHVKAGSGRQPRHELVQRRRLPRPRSENRLAQLWSVAFNDDKGCLHVQRFRATIQNSKAPEVDRAPGSLFAAAGPLAAAATPRDPP